MSQFSDWFAKLESQALARLKADGQKALIIAENVGEFVVDEAEIGLEELGSIALDAVETEAPKVLGGGEKFGSAVTNVIQTVEAKGKTILVSDAQAAVQNAYHAFQAAVTANKTGS